MFFAASVVSHLPVFPRHGTSWGPGIEARNICCPRQDIVNHKDLQRTWLYNKWMQLHSLPRPLSGNDSWTRGLHTAESIQKPEKSRRKKLMFCLPGYSQRQFFLKLLSSIGLSHFDGTEQVQVQVRPE
ncbi:unnamed protein product, partial [Dicrocoelium dendriticum]